EMLGVAHARDRGEQLVAQGTVLPLKIEQRNRSHATRTAPHQRLMTGAPQSGRSLRSSGGWLGPLERVVSTMAISSPADADRSTDTGIQRRSDAFLNGFTVCVNSCSKDLPSETPA